MRLIDRHPMLQYAVLLIKLIAVPAALVILAIKFLDDPQLQRFHIDPALLVAALLTNQIALLLFALRMRLALRMFGMDIPYLQSLRIHLQSMFYFFVLPMTIGLEAARYTKIKNVVSDQTRPVALGSALLVDRLAGATAALIWAIALFPVINFRIPAQWGSLLPILGFGIGATGVIAILLMHGRMRAWLEKGFVFYRASRSGLWPTLIVSIIMHMTFAFGVYLAARATNVQVTLLQALFAISASMLFVALPISFAGVSPIDAAGLGILIAMGIPAEQAAVFVLLSYLARLVAAFEGGGWEFYEGGEYVTRRLFAKNRSHL